MTPREGPGIRKVLGVPIHGVTMDGAMDAISDAISTRKRIQIGVVNAAKIVNMRRDPRLRDDVLSSDLIFADGMSVVWASRILGTPLPERIAGIDLMMGLLDRGNSRGFGIFFLGATDEVLQAVVDRVRREYPGVRVAGQRNGYFGESDEEGIAGEIRDSRADILLVAITSPKKEKFLARWSSIMDVPVCHGVGGSFDVYAGKVERAPEAWQKMGLEWLYRVKQEPGRLWKRYLITNTMFVGMVLFELFRKPFASAGSGRDSG
jgi:N-acetylglucosaminyldiphosphoundecaprenol N-acetyl-beta-D-mannosaminyltransferase